MRIFDQTLFRALAKHEAPICLSLYLEVAAGAGEHEHVRIAQKNAKSEAEAHLHGAPHDEEAVSAVRDRLDTFDYADIVGGHDRRVAVFIAPDLTEVVDARFDKTSVTVGTRFRLSPLLEDLKRTPDHAIPVASQEEAHLYRSSGGRLLRETVEDMPDTLLDISRFTDQQKKGNIHGREDSGIPGSYKGAQATASATGPRGFRITAWADTIGEKTRRRICVATRIF